ncbi:hypothetical protein CFE70_008885 [Pyrenophora teres f. teres 0-1]
MPSWLGFDNAASSPDPTTVAHVRVVLHPGPCPPSFSVGTPNLPLIIPKLSSILSAGSPLSILISANVTNPASTYVLPLNPLLPTSLNSSSAASAMRCLASSTRSTGLFRASGNADCGGEFIMVSEGRLGAVLRLGSNCESEDGE